jgi:hypothetical protein
MKLTPQTLKDMIITVMTDLDLLLPLPLEMEPKGTEDPPEDILSESRTQSILDALNALQPDDRARIFNRFNYYEINQILSRINQIQQATKGAL